MGNKPVKSRNKWRYAGKDLSCSELSRLARCSTSTMRYRLKHHSVKKAVAMGSGKSLDKKNKKTIFGQCKCGCGKSLYSNRQIWYDNSRCRLKWVYAAIKSGELKPDKYGICESENCKKKFPRYRDVPSSMSKRYCCYTCSRKAQNDKVDRKAIAVTNAKKKEKLRGKFPIPKSKPKIDKYERNTYCIRDGKKCEHYYIWLEYPNFVCVCKHGYTKPKNDEYNPIVVSAIDVMSQSTTRHDY